MTAPNGMPNVLADAMGLSDIYLRILSDFSSTQAETTGSARAGGAQNAQIYGGQTHGCCVPITSFYPSHPMEYSVLPSPAAQTARPE